MIIGSTPQPSKRDVAAIVWDALAENRRADVVQLLEQTIREAGDSVTEWVRRPGLRTLECRFCRAVLRELRCVRPHGFEIEPVPWSLADGDPHGERCAAGAVAELVTPRKVRRRRRAPADLPLYWEMDPCRGDVNYAVRVTIWGEGFRGNGRVRVAFGDARADIARIVSDHELVALAPYIGVGTFDVTVTVGKIEHRLAQRHWVPEPSPY